MAPRRPRQPAQGTSSPAPMSSGRLTRQTQNSVKVSMSPRRTALLDTNDSNSKQQKSKQDKIAGLDTSNHNLVSKETLEEIMLKHWTHRKLSVQEFGKMRKILNAQLEKIFDKLVNKNEDTFGCFDHKDLEQVLMDEELLIRGDKHALFAELASTFTPSQFRTCKKLLKYE